MVEEIRLNWGIDAKMFDDEIEDIFSNPDIKDVESKPKESIQTSQSEYLEDYPGELYYENRRGMVQNGKGTQCRVFNLF